MMSGPMPSPSIQSRIGLSGTCSLPSRTVMRSPSAGTTIFEYAIMSPRSLRRVTIDQWLRTSEVVHSCSLQHLPQHRLQDAAVPVVVHLDRRVDARLDLERP